jgi:hypothetical protein
MSDETKVGPTGPRGPAGDISAAVAQSKLAFEQAIAAHSVAASGREQAFRDEVKALRKELANLKTWITDSISNAVENQTIKTLEDYGVRDHNGNKITTV